MLTWNSDKGLFASSHLDFAASAVDAPRRQPPASGVVTHCRGGMSLNVAGDGGGERAVSDSRLADGVWRAECQERIFVVGGGTPGGGDTGSGTRGSWGQGKLWALPPWEAEPAFAAIATKCQGFTPGSTRTFYGVDCGETLWRTSLHITGLSDFPMLAHSTSERLATRELELSTPAPTRCPRLWVRHTGPAAGKLRV